MAKFTRGTQCLNCKRKNDIFCLLKDDELKMMNENKYEVYFNSGETIFKQGTSLTHLACITEGLVKIYIEGFNKKNLLIKLARAGDIIGGPGLLVDSMHHYSAAAVEDTRTCFIDAGFVTQALKSNNEFSLSLIKRINEASIANFDRMVTYTQKQMPGRTAEMLLYLYKGIYKTNPFFLTVSRQDMADLASMTKESMIRIIKEFKDAGILNIDGNQVRIMNEKALINISETG